ncbi:hypothetical protein TIFTF001_035969, partial [Ficus carica]
MVPPSPTCRSSRLIPGAGLIRSHPLLVLCGRTLDTRGILKSSFVTGFSTGSTTYAPSPIIPICFET